MDSKFKKRGRMVRKQTKKEESSGKKKMAPKKSISHDDDDDDSVDSHGNIRNLIDYESEESSDSEHSTKRKPRKAAIKARKRIIRGLQSKKHESESESESEDESYSESEKESEEESTSMDIEDEEDEEDEDDIKENKDLPSIIIGSFGGMDPMERMVPKRHNLKKESTEVKKFVELLTKQNEPSTIDDQIEQFKTMELTKQQKMIQALERKPNNSEHNLMFKILTMNLPPEIQTLVLSKYNSLQMMEPTTGEYFKIRAWLEKVTSLPIGIYKDLPAKIEDGPAICGAFMQRAQKCLSDAIYGQEEAKLQILQFIATKMANPNFRGMSLLLAGPPGIGKSSIIKNGIAKALDWPFQFISLGGDSDATTYTGHQVVYEGSHCGKIANSLITAKSMSMVLMFDELDKISQTPKGEEVQNLLIHLTDQVQNDAFEDKYLSGIPLDLSKAMFVFSGNDLNKIDKILLDRMIVINLQGYQSKDKLAIAENFLVPNALKEVNLQEKVSISKEIIEHVLENYAKEESGVREFKRCIEQIVQKINMLRIFNSKDMPFYISNFSLPFVLKKEHVDLFLKKKDAQDKSYLAMYT
uniref:AAA+ ATPase domain-containing protein n=1 Tax=viral metagenome TaxID=1070528 RepID=A0A6C0D6Z9_9ZZZZ